MTMADCQCREGPSGKVEAENAAIVIQLTAARTAKRGYLDYRKLEQPHSIRAGYRAPNRGMP